jgi:hypothetical protein
MLVDLFRPDFYDYNERLGYCLADATFATTTNDDDDDDAGDTGNAGDCSSFPTPNSLVECQLTCNFQMLVLQSQSLLSSFVPLLVEFYNKIIAQKSGFSLPQQLELRNNFGRELGPRLDLPFKQVILKFNADSLYLFRRAGEESKINSALQ